MIFRSPINFALILLLSCANFVQDTQPTLVTRLPLILHETSSLITAKKGSLWTMNDGPSTTFYCIDETTGAILQQVNIKGQQTEDTEALTQDGNYIYVGDFGNNHAPRSSFKILKIKKSNLSNAPTQDVEAETIDFTYEDFDSVDHSNSTQYFDCEALLSYKNNLYLFTKRRADNQTVLYVLLKKAGKQKAKKLAVFNTKGLITDAAINPLNNQVALVGYKLPGHKESSIWLLSDFKKDHFFFGKQKLMTIFKQDISWQTEGLVYKTQNKIFISCEQTVQIPCSLYKINISAL